MNSRGVTRVMMSQILRAGASVVANVEEARAPLDTATERPSSPSPREARAGRGLGRGELQKRPIHHWVTPLPNPLPTPPSWGEGTASLGFTVARSDTATERPSSPLSPRGMSGERAGERGNYKNVRSTPSLSVNPLPNPPHSFVVGRANRVSRFHGGSDTATERPSSPSPREARAGRGLGRGELQKRPVESHPLGYPSP